MYLLKKIFQLRDKANPDHEKPFLEHLEDLRIMVTRIVITLLIATIACFVLRDHLMAVLRRPVEQMWVRSQSERLPPLAEAAEPLDLETWEKAKLAAAAVAPLDATARAQFFEQAGAPALEFHVAALLLYRAALELPEENRAAFLDTAARGDPRLRRQAAALVASGPDPLIDSREDLRMMGAFNPTEAFMLSIKLAFFAGIVVSFPLLLLYVLQFVLPGLHSTEKRALWPAMAIGFGLFLTGVLFAYFMVLPRVLEFFHEYAGAMGIANEWRIGYYISFATQFTLIFGLAFELPVVVMTLVKIGILGWDTMRNTRSYAVLAIFVIAAIITPTPDAFTLCLLALPMVILYEICIWLAWWMHRKELAAEAAAEAAEAAGAQTLASRAAPPDDPTDDDPAADDPAADDPAADPTDDPAADDPAAGPTDDPAADPADDPADDPAAADDFSGRA